MKWLERPQVRSVLLVGLIVAVSAVTIVWHAASDPGVIDATGPPVAPSPSQTLTTIPLPSTSSASVATTTTPVTTALPSPAPVRNAEVVSREMVAAATSAGAIEKGIYLRSLAPADSCRSCAGAQWFVTWCGDAGGTLVGVSRADAHVFADGGPVYCYPGTRPLPVLVAWRN